MNLASGALGSCIFFNMLLLVIVSFLAFCMIGYIRPGIYLFKKIFFLKALVLNRNKDLGSENTIISS